MRPPTVGSPGTGFTAPTPGQTTTPAMPSAFAPPSDIAKPLANRPAVAGVVASQPMGVMPPGAQDPAAAAAFARQFFGFMQQGMASGGVGVPPGAFGAPGGGPSGGASSMMPPDASEPLSRGPTPGVAQDGAVTYNRKDKRYETMH